MFWLGCRVKVKFQISVGIRVRDVFRFTVRFRVKFVVGHSVSGIRVSVV